MTQPNSPQKSDLEKLPHKFQVAFAIFCAEQVLHLVREEDKAVCLRAIQVAYLFLEGKATQEECRVAANAAYAAYAADAAAYAAARAVSAAAYAVYAAAYVASAAANAAYAASAAAASTEDREKLVEAQWTYYNELLNFDEIFEKEVL